MPPRGGTRPILIVSVPFLSWRWVSMSRRVNAASGRSPWGQGPSRFSQLASQLEQLHDTSSGEQFIHQYRAPVLRDRRKKLPPIEAMNLV